MLETLMSLIFIFFFMLIALYCYRWQRVPVVRLRWYPLVWWVHRDAGFVELPEGERITTGGRTVTGV